MLRLCNRFGKGDSAFINRLPCEVVSMVEEWIMVAPRNVSVQFWEKAFRCFEDQCKPKDHFTMRELEGHYECISEDKIERKLQSKRDNPKPNPELDGDCGSECGSECDDGSESDISSITSDDVNDHLDDGDFLFERHFEASQAWPSMLCQCHHHASVKGDKAGFRALDKVHLHALCAHFAEN